MFRQAPVGFVAVDPHEETADLQVELGDSGLHRSRRELSAVPGVADDECQEGIRGPRRNV